MKLIATISCLFLTVIIFGQDAGVIKYMEVINVHKMMAESGRNIPEEYKAMVPEFRTENFELKFTPEATVYQMSKDQNDEEMMADRAMGERRMMFRGMRANNIIFKDLAAGEKVEQREFLGKRFLIIDSLDNYRWKIDPTMEEVIGYPCMKATYSDSTESFTVWFTQQIPISSGPDRYGQLPGMILKVDVKDGQRSLVATEVLFDEMDEKDFDRPSKGKEVTEAEYQEIVREKMKEMRGNRSGGPGMRPRMRTIPRQ